mgnify:CR=1 FL=1
MEYPSHFFLTLMVNDEEKTYEKAKDILASKYVTNRFTPGLEHVIPYYKKMHPHPHRKAVDMLTMWDEFLQFTQQAFSFIFVRLPASLE